MARGFVTFATGNDKYYILARNLLYSFKIHNPCGIPFAIICDRENEFTEAFDDIVLMDSPSFSFLDKVRLPGLAPYDETIFIDADSLVCRNLSGLWDIVKSSPDFGIFGAIWEVDSEVGKREFKRGGHLRARMRFACTCQGGMYYIRKTPALIPFQELSLYILDHYEEFRMDGYLSPGDDNIFPLACSVLGFPPPEDWYNLFCFNPESDLKRLDIVNGVIEYRWRYCDKVLGENCFFVHFGSSYTEGWEYRREAYKVRCFIEGRQPAMSKIIGIWVSGRIKHFVRQSIICTRRIIPLRIKKILLIMRRKHIR